MSITGPASLQESSSNPRDMLEKVRLGTLPGFVLMGLSFLEWGLFCQHIHWSMSGSLITGLLYTLTLSKFSLVLWNYRFGQAGASVTRKSVEVFWTCASLPLIAYLAVTL